MASFIVYVGSSSDPHDQSMRVVEAADMDEARRLYPDAIAVGVVEDRQIDNGLNITALKRGFVRVM
jgi:hypothetical protein